MIPTLKIALVGICGLIAYQDFRERMVSWILFPLMGMGLAALYLVHVPFVQFYPFVLVNMLLISLVILLLFLYTKYVAGQEFLNVSFGMGDLLFFYALALGFPTRTFMVLFAASLLFALAISLVMNRNQAQPTVPLAGLMGVCLALVVLGSLFTTAPSLYLF